MRKFTPLVLLALLFLNGCEVHDHLQMHREQIIVDPADPDNYTFSDLRDLSMGWISVPNGDLDKGDRYEVLISGDDVEIRGRQKIQRAEYYTDGLDREPDVLEVDCKNTLRRSGVTRTGVFRLTYELIID